jgi:hypothetical protein
MQRHRRRRQPFQSVIGPSKAQRSREKERMSFVVVVPCRLSSREKSRTRRRWDTGARSKECKMSEGAGNRRNGGGSTRHALMGGIGCARVVGQHHSSIQG